MQLSASFKDGNNNKILLLATVRSKKCVAKLASSAEAADARALRTDRIIIGLRKCRTP